MDWFAVFDYNYNQNCTSYCGVIVREKDISWRSGRKMIATQMSSRQARLSLSSALLGKLIWTLKNTTWNLKQIVQNLEHVTAQTNLIYIQPVVTSISDVFVGTCLCQLQGGVYDFGQGRFGERRGSWTPGEWLAGVLLIMTISLGLALSIGLCYYVNRRQARRTSSVRSSYRQHQQLQISIPPEEALKTQTLRNSSGQQASNLTRGATNDSSFYRDYNQRRYQQQQQQTPDTSLVVQIWSLHSRRNDRLIVW
jgi:hypothetical protein